MYVVLVPVPQRRKKEKKERKEEKDM